VLDNLCLRPLSIPERKIEEEHVEKWQEMHLHYFCTKYVQLGLQQCRGIPPIEEVNKEFKLLFQEHRKVHKTGLLVFSD
jgi:hypothetical protein